MLQTVRGLTGVLALCFSVASAWGQVSLQEQLASQYKVAKVGADSGGFAVIDAGTLLSVQKGGLLGVPWKNMGMCPSKYQDDTFHASAGFCAAMVKEISRYFQVGDKVYPTKVDVNLGKEKVSFTVVSCDACNGVNPPNPMKSEVVFQFAKGYLEKAGVGDVEDVIGKVFMISDDSQQGGQAQQGNGQGSQAQPPQQPAEQQPEPQTIQLGMTTDQVQAAMGKPEKIVNLGAKQIYVYKDLKVTFQNGKVADVQ